MHLYFLEKRFVKYLLSACAYIRNIVEKHHYLVSHIKRHADMNKIICCKAKDLYTVSIQFRAWFRVTEESPLTATVPV